MHPSGSLTERNAHVPRFSQHLEQNLYGRLVFVLEGAAGNGGGCAQAVQSFSIWWVAFEETADFTSGLGCPGGTTAWDSLRVGAALRAGAALAGAPC